MSKAENSQWVIFDDDDDWLTAAAEKYEESESKPDKNVNSSKETEENDNSRQDVIRAVIRETVTGSPLEQFRGGYLWVSDLTRQHWCEQQLFYTLTVPTIVEENPAITEGSNLHLARELAVHDVVNVKVTSDEDIWAVKVTNLLSSVQSLLHGNPVAREIPVFGAPFEEDVFMVGVIDEIKFDYETFHVALWELKTRKYNSLPSNSQQSQHRLQVMLYKKLFDDLVKGRLPKETVAKHLKLDLNKPFGEGIQSMLDLKCQTCKNLSQLLDILFLRMQCMTCVSEIGIEYVHQETNLLIDHKVFGYDEEELKLIFNKYLSFWRGSRTALGVDIEEAWKCQSCDFADICDWRKRKAKEHSKDKRREKCY